MELDYKSLYENLSEELKAHDARIKEQDARIAELEEDQLTSEYTIDLNDFGKKVFAATFKIQRQEMKIVNEFKWTRREYQMRKESIHHLNENYGVPGCMFFSNNATCSAQYEKESIFKGIADGALVNETNHNMTIAVLAIKEEVKTSFSRYEKQIIIVMITRYLFNLKNGISQFEPMMGILTDLHSAFYVYFFAKSDKPCDLCPAIGIPVVDNNESTFQDFFTTFNTNNRPLDLQPKLNKISCTKTIEPNHQRIQELLKLAELNGEDLEFDALIEGELEMLYLGNEGIADFFKEERLERFADTFNDINK